MLISWVYLYPQALGSSPSLEQRSNKIAADDLRGSTESHLRQTPGLPIWSTFLGAWTLSLYRDNEMMYVFSQACSLPLHLAYKLGPWKLTTWLATHVRTHVWLPTLSLEAFAPCVGPSGQVERSLNAQHNCKLLPNKSRPQFVSLSLYFFLTCSVFLPKSSVKMIGLNTETRIYWCSGVCVCVCMWSSLHVL